MKNLFAKFTDWHSGLKPKTKHMLHGVLIGLVLALFVTWVRW